MSLRGTFKNLVGTVCEGPLVRPLARLSARKSTNVVYYHHIGKPSPHYAAFYQGCTVSKFAQDLAQLSKVFEFVPLQEVLHTSIGRDRRRPTLALTFDDGFDLHPEVLEMLHKYGIKATTFVITSCIGNRKMMWRHMLSAIQTLAPSAVWQSRYHELASSFGLAKLDSGSTLTQVSTGWNPHRKDEWALLLWNRCQLPPVEDYLAQEHPYFSWQGLREWLAAGHAVGFHTDTHPYCSTLQREALPTELVEPALKLKQVLGIPELSFSYPFGDRLPPGLEDELFETGLFTACFGIRGFAKAGVSKRRLERAGVEGQRVGWSVFAANTFKSLVAF